MTDLSCPTCGAEFDLSVAFASEVDRRALARLAAVSIPLGARVLQYVALFTPPKQRLTAAKKIKLILQLLPDLERGAITHKGRDWPAPLAAWAQAMDQMLAARDAQRLELPMKGHGYLYAVLAGMADKLEAQQEAGVILAARDAARARAHSSGAPTGVADVLLPLPLGEGRGEGPRPAAAPAQTPGTSPTVRAMRAAIQAKKGEQP